MKLTKEEIEIDLANAESDIQALSNIVGSLDVFITRNGGEDRSAFRMDRFKYQSLLSQAHSLKQKIQETLSAVSVATDEPESKA